MESMYTLYQFTMGVSTMAKYYATTQHLTSSQLNPGAHLMQVQMVLEIIQLRMRVQYLMEDTCTLFRQVPINSILTSPIARFYAMTQHPTSSHQTHGLHSYLVCMI